MKRLCTYVPPVSDAVCEGHHCRTCDMFTAQNSLSCLQAPLKSSASTLFLYIYIFLSLCRCLSAPSKIIFVRWNTAGHYGLRRLDEQLRVIAACEGAWRAERVIATISVMALTWHRAVAACDCPQIHNPLFVFF